MRNERNRHARPDEEVQLYTGMRTRQCRLIGRAICTTVLPVRIDFMTSRVKIGSRPSIKGMAALNAFAITDGFVNWDDLRDFWQEEHDLPDFWSGVIIEWKDLRWE